MSDDRLKDLYTAAVKAGVALPAGSHPTPEAIAQLVRREGPEDARLATLDHVMSCAECRRDFDLLRTVERVGVQSGAATGPGARRSWMVPAALAASLLVAIGVGRTLLPPTDDTTRGSEDAPVVLVAPGTEAVAGDGLVFAWLAVAGARRYELELLDAGGSVAAATATSDTTASPSAVTALPPGEYQWWVRATTSDARSVRSPFRPLRVTTR